VIAVLLVIIAAVLLFAHDTEAGAPALTGGGQFGVGVRDLWSASRHRCLA
jgi:hypothetical protein